MEDRVRKIDLTTLNPEDRQKLVDQIKLQCLHFFSEAEAKSSELLKIYGIQFDIIVAVKPEDVPAAMKEPEAPKKKKGRPKKAV